MAVTSIKELITVDQRESVQTTAATTERRLFRVTCSAITDGPRAARLADLGGGNKIPSVGDSWDLSTPGLVVSQVSARPFANSPVEFLVEVVYSTSEAAGGGGESESDPLEAEPEWTLDGEGVLEDVWEDPNGSPPEFPDQSPAFRNTVGDPFPVKADIYDLRLSVTINTDGEISIGDYRDFCGAVNSGPWQGKPAETWRCLPPRVQKVTRAAGDYFQINFTFLYRADRWRRRVLNEGFNYQPAGLAAPRSIWIDSAPAASPQRLAQSGDLLAPSDESYFLEVMPYRRISFTTLPIPDPLPGLAP